jgi:hypothetical protein
MAAVLDDNAQPVLDGAGVPIDDRTGNIVGPTIAEVRARIDKQAAEGAQGDELSRMLDAVSSLWVERAAVERAKGNAP